MKVGVEAKVGTAVAMQTPSMVSMSSCAAQAVAAIRAGDAIMVKGSLGSKMKTIVNALEKRFPGKTALDEAAV